MKEKMIFFWKIFQASNPPDELAQKCFEKKSLSDESFLHFSSKVQHLTVFFKYSHDSNWIFRAGGINTETFFGGTVKLHSQRVRLCKRQQWVVVFWCKWFAVLVNFDFTRRFCVKRVASLCNHTPETNIWFLVIHYVVRFGPEGFRKSVVRMSLLR